MTRTVELEVLDAGNDSLGNKVFADVTDGNGNEVNTEKMVNEQNVCETYKSESSNQRTKEMTNIMDDLSLNSPKDRPSRSRSKTRSVKRSSSSSSSCSSSGSSSSRSSCSRSWSRSRSRDRRYQRKRSRRSSRSYSRGRSRSYSRSYSRSRSRSYSPRQRRRYSSAYRRYYRSPPRYRSRSRSCSYHSRRYSRSRSRSRGRRYYGFVRRPYAYPSYRSRSRSRSSSRTPLRLSKEEKMKLLEIAKQNASKALGKEVELPESLKNMEQRKTSRENSISDRVYHSHSFPTSHDSNVKLEEKAGNAFREVHDFKPRSPYMLWRPVTSEAKSFSKSLSPKHAHRSRAR